jgi:beta-N-acetylhexosaminidase
MSADVGGSRSAAPRATGLAIPATLLPGFVGTELPDWLRDRLAAGLGGVCLFAENIASPTGLRALTDAIRAANPDAIIAIDEEGGDVSRLHAATGSPYPGNALLGRLDDLELTATVARTVAAELRAAGVNLNFAPDGDINSDPRNPVIGVRSFGADAGAVAAHTAAWVAAHEAAGVAVSVKHFPGHGDTAQDSHLALPVVDAPADVLRARELVPFRAAVAAGARTVMTSHLVLPALDPAQPATFSPAILGGVLRDELGFDGVIVSDALDMAGASGEIGIPAAAVRALGAGCDLLCIGTRTTAEQLDAISAAVASAVEAGELPADRVEDAARRVGALAASLRATVPRPAEAVDLTVLPDAAALVAGFAVSPDAVSRVAEVAPGAQLVQIETAVNIAVGVSPWGPAAAGAEVAVVGEGDPLPDGAGPLVLIGKDIHRRAWVRALVDDARAARPTLVVEMGWPDPGSGYADIATFGASRAVGAALLGVLARRGLDAGLAVPLDDRHHDQGEGR